MPTLSLNYINSISYYIVIYSQISTLLQYIICIFSHIVYLFVIISQLSIDNMLILFFGNIPIILMAQNSRGIPTYHGRQDIVHFLISYIIYSLS